MSISEASKMELFAKPVNGFEPLAYFAKKCYLGSKYASKYDINILSFGVDMAGIWEIVEMFQMNFYKSWRDTRRIRKDLKSDSHLPKKNIYFNENIDLGLNTCRCLSIDVSGINRCFGHKLHVHFTLRMASGK